MILEIYERNGVIAYASELAPDGTSRSTFITPNVERLLGHPAAVLCEPGAWQAHVHPADRQAYASIASAPPGQPLTLEYRFMHADGQPRWLRDQLVKHQAAPDAPMTTQGVVLDITAERATADELRRTVALAQARTLELQRSNAELEQLAAVTSHDLQEPLRTIKSFAELLAQTQGERLDADGHQFLRYVTEGAERMRQLIRDLLLYARVGRPPTSMQPVDLQLVLADTLQDLQLWIRETGGRVTHDPLPTALVDRHRIGQVFQNLIGNALKFHGQAPPEIHVGVEERPDAWALHVRDNGIGIERRFSERIFGVFQRLHPRGGYEGNGVGLAIVKKIAEQHGGRAWVESSPGQGSVFSFSLAKQPPALADAELSEDEPTDTPGPG